MVDEERKAGEGVILSRLGLKLAIVAFTALRLGPDLANGVWPFAAWIGGGDISPASALMSVLLPFLCIIALFGHVRLRGDRIVYFGLGGLRTVPLQKIKRAYAGKSSWLSYAAIELDGKRSLFLNGIEFRKSDLDRVLAFVETQAREASRNIGREMPASQAKQDRLMVRITLPVQIAIWFAVAAVIIFVMNR
ncbi:hypothetical protein [Parvibaculum sp.]|jgi:hypothetical protein|uniref:hypothetical protein n=1 Tax=Parvibaculum sp. TaxID=2024848 RepID=UPI00391BC011